jgi:hypothetical protein
MSLTDNMHESKQRRRNVRQLFGSRTGRPFEIWPKRYSLGNSSELRVGKTSVGCGETQSGLDI